jgi:hypothetical protein
MDGSSLFSGNFVRNRLRIQILPGNIGVTTVHPAALARLRER